MTASPLCVRSHLLAGLSCNVLLLCSTARGYHRLPQLCATVSSDAAHRAVHVSPALLRPFTCFSTMTATANITLTGAEHSPSRSLIDLTHPSCVGAAHRAVIANPESLASRTPSRDASAGIANKKPRLTSYRSLPTLQHSRVSRRNARASPFEGAELSTDTQYAPPEPSSPRDIEPILWELEQLAESILLLGVGAAARLRRARSPKSGVAASMGRRYHECRAPGDDRLDAQCRTTEERGLNKNEVSISLLGERINRGKSRTDSCPISLMAMTGIGRRQGVILDSMTQS